MHTGFDCIYSQPLSALSEANGVTIVRLEAVQRGFFQLTNDGLSPIEPEGLPELSTATEIGLSPDGARMVVGYSGSEEDRTDIRLALVSLPEAEVLASDLRSSMTRAYTAIYANWVETVPIRWAPDGTYFVAPDAEGNIQVHSACDGATLDTLPTARPSENYVGWDGSDDGPSGDSAGPSNLAFDADGDHFVAYFPGRVVQVYDVSY